MKNIMVSIQPKWVEKILNGEKTIELRKTKPKCELPFKVYIYCTKPSNKNQTIKGCMVLNSDELFRDAKGRIKHGSSIELMGEENYTEHNFMNGKVVGEFMCNRIDDFYIYEHGSILNYNLLKLRNSCVSYDDIANYIGKEKIGYAWNISDLVIYEEPIALCEFQIIDKEQVAKCEFRKRAYTNPDITNNAYLPSSYVCTKGIREYEPEWCEQCHKKRLSRPPQSWGYVEIKD